ncbi:hypothetical protein AAV35_012640 [Salimicrobium jeotgali]|uniref:Baseplate protein J-like barrel domain-containing protein n=1 Tax=Salimicrobium jeotgali TaxID=1230341 RepID=K2G5I9_9BACI|nr:baseplate J/gp47 family protein [Salimicrobium jeotgali]APC65614.1 hypothetical protein AAV35_012640 [Salimicrobium jeotgali]EKE30498.1 hypothetical protein MJ3_13694 [Salimicrobium jeotgali]MBM7696647.1 putative phage protein gp47/JayE [Salimicrobium jeotgali]
MLNEKGFRRKTGSEIWDEIESDAKSQYGEQVNTGQKSVIGIILRIFSSTIIVLWEMIEKVYHSSFPSTSTGTSLDRLVKFKGMSRMLERESFGVIDITGTPGTFVDAGFPVSTSSDISFVTMEDVQLDDTGKTTAEIRAVKKGTRSNVKAGAITEIVEPVEHVTAVSNAEPTTGGRDRETDASLLARFQAFTESGSSSAESIESTLIEIPAVRSAIVEENTMMDATADGAPPKSLIPFVFGGTDDQVAEAIFSVKPGGIQSYGDTIHTVIDSQGKKHFIGFTRPLHIDVHVNVTLTTNEYFPSDGHERVRTSIVKYIGGADQDGTVYDGTELNEDVKHSKIIAKTFAVDGVDDVEVGLSTNGEFFEEENIPITTRQVAVTSFDKVVIS